MCCIPWICLFVSQFVFALTWLLLLLYVICILFSRLATMSIKALTYLPKHDKNHCTSTVVIHVAKSAAEFNFTVAVVIRSTTLTGCSNEYSLVTESNVIVWCAIGYQIQWSVVDSHVLHAASEPDVVRISETTRWADTSPYTPCHHIFICLYQTRGVSSCSSLGWPVGWPHRRLEGAVWLSDWCNLTPAMRIHAVNTAIV